MSNHNLHPTEEVVQDLNRSLNEYDRLVDIILSNLTVISEEQQTSIKKKKIIDENYDVVNFKIKELYFLLMKIENLVFDSTFAYYRKYHNLTGNELSTVEFEGIKHEVTYIFDSFLAQYKSLLDLTIKFVSNYLLSDGPAEKENIDSFEKLSEIILKQEKGRRYKTVNNLKQANVFNNYASVFNLIIAESQFLEEIKDYRDFIIHHGYVKHELKGKSLDGQVLFSYSIPTLIKVGKDYTFDPDKKTRLDHFCRKKMFLLLAILAEITDVIYAENLKQPHIKQLSAYPPQDIKKVLLKVCKKEAWADNVVNEESLKDILKNEGIDFNELIEDFTFLDGADKKSKKLIAPIAFEKVYYKPIGGLLIFRNRTIVDPTKAQEKPAVAERLGKPYYSVIRYGLSIGEFVSTKPIYEEILKTLVKAGLVYVVKTRDEIKYVSIKADLRGLILGLDELTQFKWSQIQYQEFTHFRERTPEETETTRTILGEGEKADEHLKREDAERRELQKEYAEWKKRPYWEKPLRIVDKHDNTILKISHKDFLDEQDINFSNWKNNQRLIIQEKEGKKESILVPFFEDGKMDTNWLNNLIQKCQEEWSGKPEHYLDFLTKEITKSKRKYRKAVKKMRIDAQPVVEKYSYLKPIFSLINTDVLSER